MKALWPEPADPLGKYAPDQPRVPAGNGARSGEWEFRGGGASTSGHDGRIVVASGDKTLLPEANSSEFDEITGHVAPKRRRRWIRLIAYLWELVLGHSRAGRSLLVPALDPPPHKVWRSMQLEAKQAVTLAGQKIRVHQTEDLSAITNYRRRSPSREMNNISFRIVRSVTRPKTALCGLTKIIGDKK